VCPVCPLKCPFQLWSRMLMTVLQRCLRIITKSPCQNLRHLAPQYLKLLPRTMTLVCNAKACIYIFLCTFNHCTYVHAFCCYLVAKHQILSRLLPRYFYQHNVSVSESEKKMFFFNIASQCIYFASMVQKIKEKFKVLFFTHAVCVYTP
jgi:hypothetical protein